MSDIPLIMDWTKMPLFYRSEESSTFNTFSPLCRSSGQRAANRESRGDAPSKFFCCCCCLLTTHHLTVVLICDIADMKRRTREEVRKRKESRKRNLVQQGGVYKERKKRIRQCISLSLSHTHFACPPEKGQVPRVEWRSLCHFHLCFPLFRIFVVCSVPPKVDEFMFHFES